AVPGGVEQGRRPRQFLVPFPGEAHQREFRHGRCVDREDRQEDHRQIEEDDVEEGIGRQPFRQQRSHRARLPAWRMTKTIASAIMVTTVMVTTESAAPSGQLAPRLNCASIAVAIMTPSLPPTSFGVT